MYDTIEVGPDDAGLFAQATEQGGYFTSAQAHEYGFSRQLLAYHAATGRFQRVRRGLYRFRDYPSWPREEVMAAWLAVGKESAVVSHESALDLLDLSDVIPNGVHLLVPRARRGLPVPYDVILHTTVHPLDRLDVMTWEGLRITSPMRTILDAAEWGTGPEQVIMAIEQASTRGWITSKALKAGAKQRGGRVERLIDLGLQDG